MRAFWNEEEEGTGFSTEVLLWVLPTSRLCMEPPSFSLLIYKMGEQAYSSPGWFYGSEVVDEESK